MCTSYNYTVCTCKPLLRGCVYALGCVYAKQTLGCFYVHCLFYLLYSTGLEMTVIDLEVRLQKVEEELQQLRQLVFYQQQQQHYNPFPNYYPFPPINTPSFPSPSNPNPSYPPTNFLTSPAAASGIQNTPASPSTPQRPRRSEPASSPLPLSRLQTDNPHALPSSRIDRSKLDTVEKVVQKHHKFRGECKAGTLACKIAKEAIFGTEIMKICTPVGSRDKPGLPTKELAELKKVMYMQFPQFWRNPVEFEPVWKRCLEAVQQGCKRLRLGKD